MAFDPRPLDKRHFNSQRQDIYKSYATQVNQPQVVKPSEKELKQLAADIFDKQVNDALDSEIDRQVDLIKRQIQSYIESGEVDKANSLQFQLDKILGKE